MDWEGLRIGLVGPLAPPLGGMARLTHQLSEQFREEGAQVELVQTNAPYRPAWAGHLRGVRALARLLPYIARLWRTCGRVDLLHIMANSGWSWHLFAAPAVWVAHMRRVPVVVNYHGGDAENFLHKAKRWVRFTMKRADVLVLPSDFLYGLFFRYGMSGQIVPNGIDLDLFQPVKQVEGEKHTLHIIVPRNLERIYGIDTALQAFAKVHAVCSEARISITGSGAQKAELEALAETLHIKQAVSFTGPLERSEMVCLYHEADIMLNPSRIDNMPVSILEAWASGVPVVSTNVGGVPFIAEEGRTALLVPADSAEKMAEAILRLHRDHSLAEKLSEEGLVRVKNYSWPVIRTQWQAVYNSILGASAPGERRSIQ